MTATVYDIDVERAARADCPRHYWPRRTDDEIRKWHAQMMLAWLTAKREKQEDQQ